MYFYILYILCLFFTFNTLLPEKFSKWLIAIRIPTKIEECLSPHPLSALNLITLLIILSVC